VREAALGFGKEKLKLLGGIQNIGRNVKNS
jgi:hypothetical protein